MPMALPRERGRQKEGGPIKKLKDTVEIVIELGSYMRMTLPKEEASSVESLITSFWHAIECAKCTR